MTPKIPDHELRVKHDAISLDEPLKHLEKGSTYCQHNPFWNMNQLAWPVVPAPVGASCLGPVSGIPLRWKASNPRERSTPVARAKALRPLKLSLGEASKGGDPRRVGVNHAGRWVSRPTSFSGWSWRYRKHDEVVAFGMTGRGGTHPKHIQTPLTKVRLAPGRINQYRSVISQ